MVTSVGRTGPLNPERATPAPTRTRTTAAATATPAPAPTRNTASTVNCSAAACAPGADFDPVSRCVTTRDGNHPPRNFYINGIRTPQQAADASRDLIADNLNQPVELLYNPTEGLIQDGIEAWRNLSGFETRISRQVEQRFRQAIDAGENIRVFAHSQGAAITSDALRNLAESYRSQGKSAAEVERLMSRVEVVGFGGFADESVFPKGVKVELERNRNDHVPQLARSCLAVGNSFNEVCAEPRSANNWARFGQSLVSGVSTVGRTLAHNAGQALEEGFRNRDQLFRAIGDGNNVNQRDLDAYFASVCRAVESDHMTVICDQQGRASSGYIAQYFDRQRAQDAIS